MQSDARLVLVVDDSQELISFLVNTVLPHCGYGSVVATTGTQALRIINDRHPDVILLDMELPDMNGLDLVEQLRRQGIKAPIIMMTARGSEEMAVRAFQLGARDCLVKPFTADQVAAAIEDALYLSHLGQEKDRL